MEKLGEYAQEESPDTKTRNFPREPILEEVTANSSELLQIVKDLVDCINEDYLYF